MICGVNGITNPSLVCDLDHGHDGPHRAVPVEDVPAGDHCRVVCCVLTPGHEGPHHTSLDAARCAVTSGVFGRCTKPADHQDQHDYQAEKSPRCAWIGCGLMIGHEGPHTIPGVKGDPDDGYGYICPCSCHPGAPCEPCKGSQECRDWTTVQARSNDRPSYYGGASNPLEHQKVAVALGWGERAFIYNATKYLWRLGAKPGAGEADDLRKAVTYLQFEIERLGK